MAVFHEFSQFHAFTDVSPNSVDYQSFPWKSILLVHEDLLLFVSTYEHINSYYISIIHPLEYSPSQGGKKNIEPSLT